MVRQHDRIIADTKRPVVLYESGFAPRWYVVRADGRISDLASFEPDSVSVQLDGTQFRLEPGQAVIPHGPGRDLTLAEALPRKTAMSEHRAASPRFATNLSERGWRVLL